jgi:FKBP-type peptidyl-prolyl cis-trans isomerase
MDLRMDVDGGKVMEGFSNFMAGSDKMMPWTQVTNILNRQIAYLRQKAIQDSNAMVLAAPEYKAKSLKFLEDNAALPGVTRLTNGVEYKVVKEGDGVMPGGNDIVTASVSAKTIDGNEIGSVTHRELNVRNPTPLPPIVGTILPMIKAGSHWEIYVPYELAYGDKPAMSSALRAPKVPPFSTVIFDIQLEAVRPGGPAPAPTPAMPPPGATPMPAAVRPNPSMPPGPPVMHPPIVPAQASSDIVRVPSTDELARGSNIEVMTLDQAIKRSQATNNAGTNK